MPIRILAGHQQGHRFDADFLALLNVHRLRFETASLDPALVHRSEEHTSELQSQSNLVCRLLLEKKNNVERIGWALEYFKERFYLQAGSKLTAEKRETTFGPPGTDVAINFPNIDHTICAVPVNRV